MIWRKKNLVRENLSFFHTVQLRQFSHFLTKISWKQRFIKKRYWNWFHEIFFGEREFLVFRHCSLRKKINYTWKSSWNQISFSLGKFIVELTKEVKEILLQIKLVFKNQTNFTTFYFMFTAIVSKKHLKHGLDISYPHSSMLYEKWNDSL